MRDVLIAVAASIALGSAMAATRTDDPAPVRSIKGGILDQIKLYVGQPPATTRVAIRQFTASDSDLVGEKKDETKTLQADGPRLLSDRFVERMKELGPFTDVVTLGPDDPAPAEGLVIEGKFTELDPGSRAKRYLVGFGSGKSAVAVAGSVKASGTEVASFEQRRVGVMGMGGGDSLGKLVSDTKNIGEDLAKFLNAWATGKKLK